MTKPPKRLMMTNTFEDGSIGSVPLSTVRQDLQREASFFREAAKTETDLIKKARMQLHAKRIEARLADEFDRMSVVYHNTQMPNTTAAHAVEQRRQALLEECRKHLPDAEIAELVDVRLLKKTPVRDYVTATYGTGKDNQKLAGDLKAVRLMVTKTSQHLALVRRSRVSFCTNPENIVLPSVSPNAVTNSRKSPPKTEGDNDRQDFPRHRRPHTAHHD